MNNNEAKIYTLLGLCMRAGKIVSGDDSTMFDLKKGKVNLVIVAGDSSNNTKKLFNDKASYRNVEIVEFSTKLQIGLAIGKSPRSVVGIKDLNFAKKLIELTKN